MCPFFGFLAGQSSDWRPSSNNNNNNNNNNSSLHIDYFADLPCNKRQELSRHVSLCIVCTTLQISAVTGHIAGAYLDGTHLQPRIQSRARAIEAFSKSMNVRIRVLQSDWIPLKDMKIDLLPVSFTSSHRIPGSKIRYCNEFCCFYRIFMHFSA